MTPLPGEDWAGLAARVFPDQPGDAALTSLRGWNLHLFLRNPSGVLLGSDVVFVGPPLAPDHSIFASMDASSFGGGSTA